MWTDRIFLEGGNTSVDWLVIQQSYADRNIYRVSFSTTRNGTVSWRWTSIAANQKVWPPDPYSTSLPFWVFNIQSLDVSTLREAVSYRICIHKPVKLGGCFAQNSPKSAKQSFVDFGCIWFLVVHVCYIWHLISSELQSVNMSGLTQDQDQDLTSWQCPLDAHSLCNEIKSASCFAPKRHPGSGNSKLLSFWPFLLFSKPAEKAKCKLQTREYKTFSKFRKLRKFNPDEPLLDLQIPVLYLKQRIWPSIVCMLLIKSTTLALLSTWKTKTSWGHKYGPLSEYWRRNLFGLVYMSPRKTPKTGKVMHPKPRS